MNDHKHLSNIKQIAAQLGVSASWVKSAVFKRQIPHIKVGRLVRFDPDEIVAWARSRRVEVRDE